MSEPRTLPLIRPDLTVQKLSDQEFVVKLRALRQYFRVGPEEAFLIEELQKPQTRTSLIRAFQKQFQEELTRSDIADFVELAKSRKLLIGADDTEIFTAPPPLSGLAHSLSPHDRSCGRTKG